MVDGGWWMEVQAEANKTKHTKSSLSGSSTETQRKAQKHTRSTEAQKTTTQRKKERKKERKNGLKKQKENLELKKKFQRGVRKRGGDSGFCLFVSLFACLFDSGDGEGEQAGMERRRRRRRRSRSWASNQASRR